MTICGNGGQSSRWLSSTGLNAMRGQKSSAAAASGVSGTTIRSTSRQTMEQRRDMAAIPPLARKLVSDSA